MGVRDLPCVSYAAPCFTLREPAKAHNYQRIVVITRSLTRNLRNTASIEMKMEINGNFVIYGHEQPATPRR